jgi:hypothetical protein
MGSSRLITPNGVEVEGETHAVICAPGRNQFQFARAVFKAAPSASLREGHEASEEPLGLIRARRQRSRMRNA